MPGFVVVTDGLNAKEDLPDFGAGECFFELRTTEDLKFQGDSYEQALKDAVERALDAGFRASAIYVFPLDEKNVLRPMVKTHKTFNIEGFREEDRRQQ